MIVKATEHFKILVIGSEGSGKTKLVNCFRGKVFKAKKKVVCGVQLGAHNVPNTNLEFCFYDVSGQQRIRPHTHSFYAGSHACIICIDPTDQGNSYATPSKSFGQTR